MAKNIRSYRKAAVVFRGGCFNGDRFVLTLGSGGTLPFRVRDYYGYYDTNGKWFDLTPKPVTVEFPENFNGFFPK